eukprot:jgi/Bigna1/80772/fgenesh1_pg.74_\
MATSAKQPLVVTQGRNGASGGYGSMTHGDNKDHGKVLSEEERVLSGFGIDEHYLERVGLFIVLVLGESITGITVNPEEYTDRWQVYFNVSLGFLIALSIKMNYFDTEVFALEDHAINRSKLSQFLFDVAHTPIVFGVALFGSGLELTLADSEKHEELSHRWFLCLSLGLVPLAFAFIQTLHKPPEMCKLAIDKKKHYSIGSWDVSAHRGWGGGGGGGGGGGAMVQGKFIQVYSVSKAGFSLFYAFFYRPVELNASKVRKATWTELFYDLVYVTVIARLGETLRTLSDWFYSPRTPPSQLLCFHRFMNDDLYHKLLFAVYMLALITVGMHIEGGPESHNGAGMAISFLGLRLIMLFAYARVVFAYFPKREAWHTTFWTAVHVCFFLCLDSGIYLFAYDLQRAVKMLCLARTRKGRRTVTHSFDCIPPPNDDGDRYYDTGNRRRCFWTVVVYNHMTSIRGLELVFSFGSSPQPCLLDDSYPDGQAEGVGADSNSADSEFKRVILQLRYSQVIPLVINT